MGWYRGEWGKRVEMMPAVIRIKRVW